MTAAIRAAPAAEKIIGIQKAKTTTREKIRILTACLLKNKIKLKPFPCLSLKESQNRARNKRVVIPVAYDFVFRALMVS
jgi:hypothetical protein